MLSLAIALCLEATLHQSFMLMVLGYPSSPNQWQVNVVYQPLNNEDMLLEILDIQGRLIQSKRLNQGGMVQFDLSHLPDGTYIARFSQQHLMKEVTIIKAE